MATDEAIPLDCLNEADKERTRYHLGYLLVSFAPSIQLGIPRPLQTIFLVEQALETLRNKFAVERVRCLLDQLDRIEAQIAGSTCLLAADRLGNLQLHPLRQRGHLVTDSLEREYVRWASRLADILGVPLYPYSKRFRKSGPGAILPVRGG